MWQCRRVHDELYDEAQAHKLLRDVSVGAIMQLRADCIMYTLTAEQVLHFVQVFKLPQARAEAAVALYSRTVDPDEFWQVGKGTGRSLP